MCAHTKQEEGARVAGVEAALRAIRGAGVGELEAIARAVEARRRELVLAGEAGETLPPTPRVVEALRGRLAATGDEDLRAQEERGRLRARALLVLPLSRGGQAEEALFGQDRRPGGGG